MNTPSPSAVAALHPARMGLEPLALTDWLKPQAGDDAMLAERVRLIATQRAAVIATRPEGDGAVAELAALLRTRGFTLADTRDSAETLASIGRAVAEDLCVLTPTDDSFRLTAGVLCFPNRWRLADKIGGGLLSIHGPVPDYAGSLAETVDRFLVKLRPLRAYVRSNWGLSPVPDLFLPEPTPAVDPTNNAGFFLRREAQSFLKLPDGGAVVFAIRTTLTPWEDVDADLRAGIRATLGGLSPAWVAYKSIRP
jgi:hypothetical protein